MACRPAAPGDYEGEGVPLIRRNTNEDLNSGLPPSVYYSIADGDDDGMCYDNHNGYQVFIADDNRRTSHKTSNKKGREISRKEERVQLNDDTGQRVLTWQSSPVKLPFGKTILKQIFAGMCGITMLACMAAYPPRSSRSSSLVRWLSRGSAARISCAYVPHSW